MKKKESKLANLLPKASSLLPIGLGINLARYSQECTLTKNSSQKTIEKFDVGFGIYGELFRDIPTAAIAFMGEPAIASAYFVVTSYIFDKSCASLKMVK
jgi:hypothetical protein